MKTDHRELLHVFVAEHIDLFFKINKIDSILDSSEILINSLKGANKILICGNGGSAADSQHFAAELIGRFEKERDSLPAIALTTDTSILTAVGNDYGFDAVFERQVKGLGRKGDVLIGISTSGNSPNVIRAINQAKAQGVQTIGLLGKDGGKIGQIVDISVIVPHGVTARIQEVHLFILHYWASVIEKELFP